MNNGLLEGFTHLRAIRGTEQLYFKSFSQYIN